MKFGSLAPWFFRKRQVLVLSAELTAASYRADEIRFGKLIPHFRDQQMGQISTFFIEEYLDGLVEAGLTAATRNRYRALLHCYFKYAMRAGKCRVNPVAEIRILSERRKSRELEFWHTADEMERYIAAAERLGPVPGIAANLLCLGGGRVGEIMALQFEDIKEGFILVHKVIERHTRRLCHRTKGQRAGGGYPMLMVPRLHQALLKWASTALFRKGTDFIVQRENGQHFDYDRFVKMHRVILACAGVKKITVHCIRRSFANNAKKAGFHTSEIQDLLGHETPSATEGYTDVDMEYLLQKAKRSGFGA